MALTKVTGHVVKPDTNIQFHNTKSTGIVTFAHTNNATSSTTGALQVTGGVGIVKDLHVGGNVTVGGTLTYDDVTNIDSLGIITARGGIHIGPVTAGVATVYTNGNASFTGIVTATEFVGALTGTASGNAIINTNADNRVITGGSGVNLYAESTFTFDGTDVQVPDKINLNTNGSYVKENQLQFKPSGTAYIDHGTTSQNITFRMSKSSSLDTNVLIVSPTGLDINGQTHLDNVNITGVTTSTTPALDTNVFNIMRNDNQDISLFRIFQHSGAGGGSGGCHINTSNRALMISATTNAHANDGLYLKQSGEIGIGISTPTDKFHVYHATDNYVARFESGDAGGGIVLKDNTHATTLLSDNGAFEIDVDNGGDLSSGESIAFKISGSEKLRINTGGDVILGGHDAVIEPGGYASHLEIHGTATDAGISIVRYSANAGGPTLLFGKSNNNTIGSISKVDEDDNLGKIEFYGVDTDWEPGASIRAFADGEWRSGSPGSEDNTDSPGRLEFHTTPNGSDNLQERMRITNGGNVLIDTTVTTEAGGDFDDLIIGSTSDTSKGISIVGSTTGGVGSLTFTDGASYKNQGIIQYRHVDDSMRFTTNQYERIRINKTGCVGIGSTGTDQRLQVSGNIELNAHDSSSGNGGYYYQKGLIIGNAFDAGVTGLTDDRNGIIWQERGLDLDIGTNNTFVMKLKHDGNVGIGTNDPQTQLDVRGSSSASITIGLNNGTKYGNFSCDNSATYLYGYNGNDIIFSTHTANSFNRKATLTNYGRLAVGPEDTPTTQLYVGISSNTQWSASKNVSNTTNLDFLALDLINTNNDTNSEVGLMMEAGSSSAAQMTISTKKVSANYAELAIRTRDGGSSSMEIFKVRGNGIRYLRTGGTIDIVGGSQSASITPSNGDYIDFARVNYANAAMGDIFIKWTSIQAPACCHHGAAHIRIGSNHLTYFYGWNDWIDVVSSQAHNSGWFSHWRLRKVTVSGTAYLYLQGKWSPAAVSSGSFQVTIGKSAYHPNGGGVVEALTPVVDNNGNGDTSGSNVYGPVQAQVQGKREADSPAVTGDRINKSHSGIFHAYKGLDTQGQISAYNQPRMSAYKSAGQTYDTTPTIVTYGGETFDNGNDYNTSTSKFTCPMDGVYFVSYSANINAGSNWGYLECRVNGSAAFTHTRIMHYNFPRLTFAGSNYCNCAQGDEIAIYAWTNTGTLSGDNFGLFQVYMLS